MAFSDSLYIVIFAFVFITVVLASSYIFNTVMGAIGPDLPVETNTSVNAAWSNNVQFADDSFAAIWFILAAISIGLTIFLGSHPVVLAVWLMFNFVCFFVYDVLSDFLTEFLTTDLNTGVMNDAVSFVTGGMAKAIVVINVLIGAVLFGKRVLA